MSTEIFWTIIAVGGILTWALLAYRALGGTIAVQLPSVSNPFRGILTLVILALIHMPKNPNWKQVKLSWSHVLKKFILKIKPIISIHNLTKTTVYIIIGVCIAIPVLGHYFQYGSVSFRNFSIDFYNNYFAEILSVLVTVFSIDRLNQMREQRKEERAEKESLISQMGGLDKEVAFDATRRLHLKGWLQDGTLEGISLRHANLSKADLSRAFLELTDLRKADLSYSNLYDANLSGANLREADLREADLTGANLSDANLSDANLSGANLSGANLREADLSRERYSVFTYAEQYGADLSGVDLSGADLTGAVLLYSRYTKETKWPKGFDPKASGTILIQN